MEADRAKVYLVGAGPGDPDLLTRKAERILAQAEAVIYDKLVSPEILALANPNALFVHARKQQGLQEEVQAEIYAWYLRLRATTGPVVRLKSGDPMVFGRGGEELEFLTQHGFDVEVVPGISAVTAAPALAGIPLTYRGVSSSFTVLAGHRQALKEIDWPAFRHAGTLVVLMGVENRAAIANSLINGGRPKGDPVAFLQYASTDRERVLESTLEQVARGEADVEAPAVFVIGEVVRLRTTPHARLHETAVRQS
ncbi:MAG TPA: uroporphyrinogen-III C-methyltransferase [Bryobacteraceae bacterium]|jgi:uroporphyrin-III C-methyltransferase